MKLKVLGTGALSIALLSFTPFSFAEKDVVGMWKMDAKSVTKMVKVAIDKAVEANPAVADQIEENKDKIAEVIASIRVNIKADHTYESTTGEKNSPGKWAMANKDHAIVFTKADGTVRRDSILESTATVLKTINGTLKDTISYVHP